MFQKTGGRLREGAWHGSSLESRENMVMMLGVILLSFCLLFKRLFILLCIFFFLKEWKPDFLPNYIFKDKVHVQAGVALLHTCGDFGSGLPDIRVACLLCV